jgi:hypothetical protein
VDHAFVYQTICNNGAADWLFFMAITSWANALFIRLDFVSGSSAQEI